MRTDNLLQDALKKRKLAPGVAYLARPGVLTLKSDSSLSLNDIESAWACVAANVVKKANEEFVAHIKSGKDKEVAMEMTSQSRFIAAKLHTFGYISTRFKEAVEEMKPGPERDVLDKVSRLYSLWQIEENQGAFLKCEQFSHLYWNTRPPYIGTQADLFCRRILLRRADGQSPSHGRWPLCRHPRCRQ
jgi:acyl-CoA oxidase